MTNNMETCECPICVLADTNTNICGFVVETSPKSARPITNNIKELTEEQIDNLVCLVVACEKKHNLRKRGDAVGDEDTYFHYNVECVMCSGKRRMYKVCFHAHGEEEEVADDPTKTD